MDFLSKIAKTDEVKPASDQPNNPEHKPSNSDLFSSAKVVAEAAQAQFRNEPEKYDKTKVAGAAADILDAAGEYGKLDETTGVGKYVDQAEDYLRKYGNTSQRAAAAPPSDSGETKTPIETTPESKETEKKTEAEVTEKKPEAEETEKTPEAEGGTGDYVKKGEGFLNQPSGGGEGDLMKMAGDFLKK